MAENYTLFTVPDELERNNLELVRIDQSDTIGEAIRKINKNFENIARHGGGPAGPAGPAGLDGLDGLDGLNGEDGEGAEFIYTRFEGDMEAGKHYPTSDADKGCLFTWTELNGNNGYSWNNGATVWYDNPQGVDLEHKTEWVFIRTRKVLNIGDNDTKTYGEWSYTGPVIWAHWGEKGTDGDGVEYIFCTADEERGTNYDWDIPKLQYMNTIQKIVFQIDDFVPGREWFTDSIRGGRHHDAVSNVLKSIWKKDCENKDVSEYKFAVTDVDGWTDISDWDAWFEYCWNTGFGMYTNVPDNDSADDTDDWSKNKWTDNPHGVSTRVPFEYVSIRRKTVDKTDPHNTEGVWGDFSAPALWASYGSGNRVFIVYCNMLDGQSVEGPRSGRDGWWDRGNDKLVLDKEDHDMFKEAGTNDNENLGVWTDNNVTIIVDGSTVITWMSSGVFGENGENISWSAPFRITGEHGINGKDGSTIQFIYAIEDEFENIKWPGIDDVYSRNKLFSDVDKLNKGNEYSVNENDKYEPHVQYPFPNDGSDPGESEDTADVTFWYDNAQQISPAHKTVWVWSRSRSATTEDSTWTYAPKPVVWAHWGEDGTDGDGVEYVFVRKFNDIDSSESESESIYNWGLDNHNITNEAEWDEYWNNIRNGSGDDYNLAKFILCLNDLVGDFYPGEGWFNNDNNKSVIKNKLLNPGNEKIANSYSSGLWNNLPHDNDDVETFVDNNWDAVKTLLDMDFTDNPKGTDVVYPEEYVSIRKFRNGAWRNYSYPERWSCYNTGTEVAMAFTSTHPDYVFSATYRPKGIVTDSVSKRKLPRPDNECTWGWGLDPEPTKSRPQVWMTSAVIREGDSNPEWTPPTRLGDDMNFNVEWSKNDITQDEIDRINADFERGGFNLAYYFENVRRYPEGVEIANYDELETAAETRWREAIEREYRIQFSDKAKGAYLMATCQRIKGKWSNWQLIKIRGDKGEPGTSLNIKGSILYEISLGENENYTPDNVNTAFDTWSTSDIPEPVDGTLAIVIPYREDDEDERGYMGYEGNHSLSMWVWRVNDDHGSWVVASPDSTSMPGLQTGDTYVTVESGHLIIFEGTRNAGYTGWIDAGRMKGDTGDSYKNVTVFANPISESEYPEIISAYDTWYNDGRPDYSNIPENIKDVAKVINQKKVNEADPDYIYIKKCSGGTSILDAHYLGNCTYNLNDKNPPALPDPSWTWTEFHGQDAFGYEIIYAKLPAGSDRPRCPRRDLCENPGDEIDQWEANAEKYDFLPFCQGIHWVDDIFSKTDVTGEVDIYRCWRKKLNNGTWSEFMGEEGPLENSFGDVLDKWGNVIIKNSIPDDENITWIVDKKNDGNPGNPLNKGDDSTPVMVQYAVLISDPENLNKVENQVSYYLALEEKAILPEDYHLHLDGSPTLDWKTRISDTGYDADKKYLYELIVTEYTNYIDYSYPGLIKVYGSDSTKVERWFVRSNDEDDPKTEDGTMLFTGNLSNPFPDLEDNDVSDSDGLEAGVEYWVKDKIGFRAPNGDVYSFIWCIDDIIVDKQHNYSYPYIISRSVPGIDGKSNANIIIDNPSDYITTDEANKVTQEYVLRTVVHLYVGGTELEIPAKTDGSPMVSVTGDPIGESITTEKSYISDASRKGVEIKITIPEDSIILENVCNCRIKIQYDGCNIYTTYKIYVDKKGNASWHLNTSTSAIHITYENTLDPQSIKVTVTKMQDGESETKHIVGGDRDYKVFYSGDNGVKWKEYTDTLDNNPDGEIFFNGNGESTDFLNTLAQSGKLQMKLFVRVGELTQWTLEGGVESPMPSAYCIYGKQVYAFNKYYNNNNDKFKNILTLIDVVENFNDLPTDDTISDGKYGIQLDGCKFKYRNYHNNEGGEEIQEEVNYIYDNLPTTWQ